MADAERDTSDGVGPVLQAGVVGDAVIAAIMQCNAEVALLERGAYRRVLVPRRCVVTRSAIEEHLGRTLYFPSDLEKVMLAFKGQFTVSEEQAVWTLQDAEPRHLAQR